MHAVTRSGDGGPEVLGWGVAPDPAVAAGDVLIKVTAAGLNRADLLQRQGFYPPPPGASEILGMECSGTVIEIGAEVSGLAVGDKVCALLSGGGYAQLVAVPAAQCLPVPSRVSLIDAAGLPEVACTVHANIVTGARLHSGETLLVHGGSSGIGTFAIQYAKALGARVAVTAGSAAKLDRCRELGADVLVNYREQDFVEVVGAADVVLDNMGAKYLERNVAVLAPGGRLVVIGMQGGAKGELDLAALLTKRASVAASSLRARPAAEKAAIVADVREHVWPLIESGQIRPIIDQVLPMTDAGNAHQLMADSGHVGKILLATPGGAS